MDLFAAEQRNGKAWVLARHGALACFLAACALLGVSLLQSDTTGSSLSPWVPEKASALAAVKAQVQPR